MTRKYLLTGMMLLFASMQANGTNHDSIPIFESSIAINYSNKTIYRGIVLGEKNPLNVAFDFSMRGITLNAEIEETSSDLQNYISIELSYGYSLGPVDLFFGLTDFRADSLDDRTDIFIELYGNPVWGGNFYSNIIPSLFVNIDPSSSGTYFTKLKFEKYYENILDNYLVNPYIEVAFGNFATSSSEFSHTELGIDITRQIQEHIFFSIFFKNIFSYNNVKRINNSSHDLDYGLMLQYQF